MGNVGISLNFLLSMTFKQIIAFKSDFFLSKRGLISDQKFIHLNFEIIPRQFLDIQLDRQPSRQTAKLETAAFPAQQLSLHSSTASHSQPATAQTNRPSDSVCPFNWPLICTHTDLC